MMENAVKQLEQAVRDVDSKLDTMTWKLEEFEKGIINVVKNKPSRAMVSVMELMLDISNMRNDYNMLRDEMLSVEQSHKDIKATLTEEINSVANEFFAVKNLLKSTKTSP